MAIADQDPAIASYVQTQWSPAGVGDDCGLAAAGWNPHDAPVLQTRPQLTGRVDDDILGPVPGKRDDSDTRRRHVRQRVDRWRLPPDRVDTRFVDHAETLEPRLSLRKHLAQDRFDGVELGLTADQRRRQLDDGIAAIVGAAVQAVLEQR